MATPQSLGGKARAAKLSPKRRREIAAQAVRARWANHEEQEAQKKRMQLVIACLLDHYLACYEDNEDRLAREAEALVPDWKTKRFEWKP